MMKSFIFGMIVGGALASLYFFWNDYAGGFYQ